METIVTGIVPSFEKFADCRDMFELVCTFLGNNDQLNLLNLSKRFLDYRYEFGHFQLTLYATSKFLNCEEFRNYLISRVSDWKNQIGFRHDMSCSFYCKTELQLHVYNTAIKINKDLYSCKTDQIKDKFLKRKLKKIIGLSFIFNSA